MKRNIAIALSQSDDPALLIDASSGTFMRSPLMLPHPMVEIANAARRDIPAKLNNITRFEICGVEPAIVVAIQRPRIVRPPSIPKTRICVRGDFRFMPFAMKCVTHPKTTSIIEDTRRPMYRR